LNVNALNWNPVGFLEEDEDEDFGSDVMEQEDQLGVTPLPAKSNYANEVIINLFTLQNTDKKKMMLKCIMLGMNVVDKVEIHFQKKNCLQ
jgi:hypothetical protein